ncbi:reverse transcriptase (RNA-dependent DNA polymerase) [Hirsutella rhossiliensis]
MDHLDHLDHWIVSMIQRSVNRIITFQHNHYDPYHDLISDSDHLITWLQSTVYDLRLITNVTYLSLLRPRPVVSANINPTTGLSLGNITGRHTLKALQTGSTNSGHTVSPQDMMREIISLRQEVQVLRNGGGNGQVRDIGEAVKPKQPGPFDGTHGTLRDFLTQLKAYHRFYPTKLSDPVERYSTQEIDFLDNQPARRDNETDEVFASFQGFEEAITKVFGTTDEEREAEQKLRELRQRISASDYAAKFRQVTSKLDWDDEPLMSRFYDGLKEEVKDELYKENRPDNLSDYIAMAVRIDDRQYARRQEKKQGRGNWNPSYGNNFNRRANYKKKRETPLLTPTQLTQAKWTWMQQRRAKENASTAESWTFLTKLQATSQGEEKGKRHLNATNKQEPKHELLSWTACYDDKCTVHLSDKNGTGWFPKPPKKTLAMKQVKFAEPEHPYPEGVSQDWIRKNGKRFQEDMRNKNRQQRRAVYKQHNKEDTDAALMLTKLGQQPEEEQRSFDDTSSEEQDTLQETEDEDELENATIGEHAPYFEEFEEMLKIGTQQIPQILTENQQAALIRYQPAPRGGDYAVAIAAVDTFTALQREWQPRGEFSDDPRTVLIRFDGQILSKPYLSTELDYWKIDQRYPNDQVMLLEPDYGTPLECRDDYGSLTRCLSETCKIHKHAKIGEWHNATRSKASEPSIFTRLAQRIRCDEEDYNEFHEHEKARAWHKRHNGAPKDYWRHLRRLQATFDQGKINAEELRAKQKDAERKLDSWYENEQNCEARVEKQEIFDWLQEISLLSPDTTPRDENIKKRYQQQIEEEYPNETNKDQAKRDQGPYAWQRQAMATKWYWTSKSRDITYTHYWIAARWAITFHLESSIVTDSHGDTRKIHMNSRISKEAFNYNNGIIDMEIDHLDINIQGHDERVDFDIMDIGEHDLVLGLPWLQESNPLINWKTGQLRWNDDASFQDQQIWEKAKFCDDLATEQDERDDRSSKSLRASAIQTKTATEPADTTKSTDKTHVLTNTAVQPGIRHKQNKGHNKKIRRVIATLRKDLEQINKELEMKNIPQEYRKYDKLFKEELETGLPEHSQWDHEICLKDGRTPTFHKIYNLNEKQLQTLRDYLDENLRKGYIRTSTSEAGYPVMFTPKRYYNEGPNTITAYIGTTRSTARQKMLSERNSDYSNICYLQRMINNVLREHLDIFVVVYLDDILIFSDTLEEHKEHVHKVLRALQNAKLLVEPEKSKFHTQEVDFLGHTISPGEIRMQQDKINSVKEWPTPKNVKDVQNCNTTTRLNEEGKEFTWDDKANEAFECIKTTITQEPVLTTFDPERQIELETDASDFALGAQIGQKDDEGRLRPIAFYSKKLHGAELNYPIYDKEFLAIIQAFKEFRHYLLGSKHKIKVYTDHKNISHFATTQQLNGRQIRWAESDALSRRSDYDTGAPIVKGQLLELNNEGNMQQRQLNAIFKVNPDEGLTKKIQQAYDKVDWEPLPVVWEDGLAKHQGKIFVPEELQDEVIREIHEHPTHGHQGIRRTMERIRRIYDFPRMKKRISETIRKCELCARSKAERHKPYGELQPLPVPKKPWDSIAFDHITKLPPSKEPMTNVKYDSIFVITDRLTKYGYFLPYKEASNAEELAYVFLRTIRKHICGQVLQALMAQLGTKHKLSTAYHPQTDGQTERLNQTLEQYLRCYISYEQNDWVKWLPTAQLAYNSSVTETTKLSPAYANYGYNPEAFKVTRQGPQAERAILQADQLRKLHEEMQQELQFVRERMSTHYNRKRLQGPIFREGDMVYLVRRNIKTKRPSNKLDFKKLGPFKVKKTISKVNYELSLPTTMRIHPIFHISLLEPAPRDAKPQDKIEVDDDQEYEAEQILDTRRQGQQQEYLVKWKEYGPEENTWEPLKHLTHCGSYFGSSTNEPKRYLGVDSVPVSDKLRRQPIRMRGTRLHLTNSTLLPLRFLALDALQLLDTIKTTRNRLHHSLEPHLLWLQQPLHFGIQLATLLLRSLELRLYFCCWTKALGIASDTDIWQSVKPRERQDEHASGMMAELPSITPRRATRFEAILKNTTARIRDTAAKAGLEGKTKRGGDLMLRPDQRLVQDPAKSRDGSFGSLDPNDPAHWIISMIQRRYTGSLDRLNDPTIREQDHHDHWIALCFQHNHYDPYHDLISDSDHLITWLQSTVYDLRLITNVYPLGISPVVT